MSRQNLDSHGKSDRASVREKKNRKEEEKCVVRVSVVCVVQKEMMMMLSVDASGERQSADEARAEER